MLQFKDQTLVYFFVVKSTHYISFIEIENIIAMLVVTSSIVINVPIRGLVAVVTEDSFLLWLAKFKYQKTCL